MSPLPSELTPVQLRRTCDANRFPFTSTADAPGLDDIIGQERATRAIEFGVEIDSPGYHIFAMGPAGAGKTSIIIRFLESKAARRPVPIDWGYVYNYVDPDRPRALRLPSGEGQKIRQLIDAMLQQAALALRKTFSSDQYAEQRNGLERKLDQDRSAFLQKLDQEVHVLGFDLVRTANGLGLAPASNGKALSQEQFEALPEEVQATFAKNEPEAAEALERTLRQVRELEQDAQEKLGQLDQEIAQAALAPLVKKVLQDYPDWSEGAEYLAAVQNHMAQHGRELSSWDGTPKPQEGQQPPAGMAEVVHSPLDRYKLNVMVDHQGQSSAPVVFETNPTYANLLGRVELRAEYGMLVTDHRHIRPGALHRANGGYLVLDARVMLRQPMAWEALKQSLRHGWIRMEEVGQQPGVLATATLTPEPIPLDVKVVLIGDPQTYYLLYSADEQFESLFKVRADFAVEMSWTDQSEMSMARFVRSRCEAEGLRHFNGPAVAQVIEYSGRLVESQRKLTTRFSHVNNIIREAAFWAQRAGHEEVQPEDVTRAIEERVYRSNQYQEKLLEMMLDGTILVDTRGQVVGQVNGLAVLSLGDYSFGRPSRISARTYQGRAGFVNIEREAHLSGRLHDKGMLILTGFLGGRYASDQPLTLSASLAFEQSYEGVDGDSASSTELYALLSSLANLPIRQDFAVTGSVNQFGQIQAIGGANEKIEGFFDVCRLAPGGLTGTQGVLLPASNVPTLMLRTDIVAAVAEGKFHIYPIATVDEGIEMLTGVPAGERDADGNYPPESVNGRVMARLKVLGAKARREERIAAALEPEPAEPPTPDEAVDPADS
jgi:lon-related putative ATP-dependent protease